MKPPITIEIPPHGYVRYIDHLGDDQRIVEAARVSYHSPSKGLEADKKLLMYLFRNRHTSPFEQCNITFNIKFPIFLMRQFVRHRTFRLNEVSARYTELPAEFYSPKDWRKMAPAGENKQGSVEVPHDGDWHDLQSQRLTWAYTAAYNAYETLLRDGVCKEQARMVLPVGIYTEIYVNIDVHNLMHFLRLRLDGHAQSEMRDVAQAMFRIAMQLYPWTFEAFQRFQVSVVDHSTLAKQMQ